MLQVQQKIRMLYLDNCVILLQFAWYITSEDWFVKEKIFNKLEYIVHVSSNVHK